MNETSDSKPIIDAIERLSVHHPIDGVSDAIVVPKAGGGREVVDLRPMLDARADSPPRAKGTSAHTTLDSIIAHAKRQKLPQSVLFASDNPERPRLMVVYNYDYASVPEEGDEPIGTGWRDHRASYDFQLSEEWSAWTKVAHEDAWLPQAAFAELLEARVLDVLDPASVDPGTKAIADKLGLTLATPAALLSAAKSIAINAARSVTQAVNLSTGETEVQFAETHVGKGGTSAVVPSAFALKLPVFRGGAPYVVLARLRYRMNGPIVWGVRLHRADLSFRHAFTEACERAAKETGLPLFYGTPE